MLLDEFRGSISAQLKQGGGGWKHGIYTPKKPRQNEMKAFRGWTWTGTTQILSPAKQQVQKIEEQKKIEARKINQGSRAEIPETPTDRQPFGTWGKQFKIYGLLWYKNVFHYVVWMRSEKLSETPKPNLVDLKDHEANDGQVYTWAINAIFRIVSVHVCRPWCDCERDRRGG